MVCWFADLFMCPTVQKAAKKALILGVLGAFFDKADPLKTNF